MAHYYLDSSALVKRYVAEAGTVWVDHLQPVQPIHDLINQPVRPGELIFD